MATRAALLRLWFTGDSARWWRLDPAFDASLRPFLALTDALVAGGYVAGSAAMVEAEGRARGAMTGARCSVGEGASAEAKVVQSAAVRARRRAATG